MNDQPIEKLSVAQLQILTCLLIEDKPTVSSRIPESFGLKTGIQYQTIKTMERRGWIDTWFDQVPGKSRRQNRRARLMVLTPAGREAAQRILAQYQVPGLRRSPA